MDITMIGLQNAGKTSLLRVLAVRRANNPQCNHHPAADLSVTDRAVNLPSSMSLARGPFVP
jgi:hypothetical protein